MTYGSTFDVLGEVHRVFGIGAVTIPSAGATYTDHDTVLAVQQALKDKGFDPGPLDGIFGPKTAKAIRAMQATIPGVGQTGVIDYGVLMALQIPVPAATSSSSSSGSRPRGSALAPSGGGYASAVPGGSGALVPTTASDSFWMRPLWAGAPIKMWQGLGGLLAGAALAAGIAMIARRR